MVVSDAAMFVLGRSSPSAFSSAKAARRSAAQGVEQQLRESEGDSVRDLLSGGGRHRSADRSAGKFLLVNDQLCEILGYTPADLRATMFPRV